MWDEVVAPLTGWPAWAELGEDARAAVNSGVLACVMMALILLPQFAFRAPAGHPTPRARKPKRA